MPIEIRELVIKASVKPDQAPHPEPVPAATLAQLRQQLLKECVDRVLEQLADAERR